ncbi:hypothetical protein DFJ77DRAFT_253023 [Powellomyces hirtus]|nr:hypothetical protein DFJ77DRAFT_253023 [Powellomyces hirtus]
MRRPKNGLLASGLFLLSLQSTVNAQAATFSFDFSNNGIWVAGSSQTVTFTLNRVIQDTLFLESVTLGPSVPVAGAEVFNVCGDLKVAGAQLNTPCPAGVCTTVNCRVTVPADYPTVKGMEAIAKWKDCKEMPLIGTAVPFCGGTISITKSLLAIAEGAPVPGPTPPPQTTPASATPTRPPATPTPVSSTSSLPLSTTASASATSRPTTTAAPVPEKPNATSNAVIESGRGTADESDSNSTGRTLGIIGGIIGGLMALIIGGAFAWRYRRRKAAASKWNPDFGTLNNRPQRLSYFAKASLPALPPTTEQPVAPPRQDVYRYPSPDPYSMQQQQQQNQYGRAEYGFSPYNINTIQETGGLNRLSTTKTLGLHVVNWEPDMNTPSLPERRQP